MHKGIKTVEPIPICCGSCKAFGTLNGARCYFHGSTFAIGICDDYAMKEEYSVRNPSNPASSGDEYPQVSFFGNNIRHAVATVKKWLSSRA